jgi:hypothetical protein
LEEKRVDCLDARTIDALLQDDDEGFELMKQRPKIVKSHSKDELIEKLQEIEKINGQAVFQDASLD